MCKVLQNLVKHFSEAVLIFADDDLFVSEWMEKVQKHDT